MKNVFIIITILFSGHLLLSSLLFCFIGFLLYIPSNAEIAKSITYNTIDVRYQNSRTIEKKFNETNLSKPVQAIQNITHISLLSISTTFNYITTKLKKDTPPFTALLC